jgi:hypothetical protein
MLGSRSFLNNKFSVRHRRPDANAVKLSSNSLPNKGLKEKTSLSRYY